MLIATDCCTIFFLLDFCSLSILILSRSFWFVFLRVNILKFLKKFDSSRHWRLSLWIIVFFFIISVLTFDVCFFFSLLQLHSACYKHKYFCYLLFPHKVTKAFISFCLCCLLFSISCFSLTKVIKLNK